MDEYFLNKAIKRLIEKKKKTQSAFAEEVEMKFQNINAIINEREKLGPDRFVYILKKLNLVIDPDQFYKSIVKSTES